MKRRHLAILSEHYWLPGKNNAERACRPLCHVLFAMLHEVNQRPALTLKTSPALADLLREQHADVFPSAHLNKTHWSTLYLDGELKDSQIYYLVDASLQQALATKGGHHG